jgi:hypothetical protein
VFVTPAKPVPDLIREAGVQRARRRAAGLNEDKTLKSHAIKIDNIPRHPGAGRGPEKNYNINLILDTGLRRYDEEEMKFHTSKIKWFWIALTLHCVPGLRRNDDVGTCSGQVKTDTGLSTL